MKYFKHESDALFNKKMRRLKREYKSEGYGIYFQIIELIAADIEKKNPEDWGYLPAEYLEDSEFLAEEIATTEELLLKVIQYCYDIGLFECRNNRLYCSRVLESADEYTQKLIKSMEAKKENKSGEEPEESQEEKTVSGENRDSVAIVSGIRTEEEQKKNKTEEEKNRVLSDKPKAPRKKLDPYKRLPESEQQPVHRIAYCFEDITGSSIVNWGKAAKAVSMMLRAQYSEKQMKWTIRRMYDDEFYEDKGFDLMTVANNIDKYKAIAIKEIARKEKYDKQSNEKR